MNFSRSLAEWRRYRQTCKELGRLSSRELDDIGYSRADIRSIARAAARA